VHQTIAGQEKGGTGAARGKPGKARDTVRGKEAGRDPANLRDEREQFQSRQRGKSARGQLATNNDATQSTAPGAEGAAADATEHSLAASLGE